MDKRKSKDKAKRPSQEEAKPEKIIDLDEFRKHRTEERRRECERILFNRVLGVYSFAENAGLRHVEIMDVSPSGLRFREEKPDNPMRAGQKVPLRFYFTPSSFLRIVIEIKRVSPFKDAERMGLEYGGEMDTSTRSYEVMRQLITFMQKYSELASPDNNPPMIWF